MAKSTSETSNRAIALQYSDIDALPRVLANAAGEAAQQIIKLADEYGVPIERDEELTQMLSNIPVGSVISPESYRLVATIISFLYHTDQEWREGHQMLAPVLD